MQIVSYTENLDSETNGKFVQFVWGGEEYLVFGPFSKFTFHIDILSRFLDDSEIPYKRLDSDHLLIKDSVFNVLGGGRFRLNPQEKVLELYDNSQVYGRFEEFELGKKIANAAHVWSEFDIRIR